MTDRPNDPPDSAPAVPRPDTPALRPGPSRPTPAEGNAARPYRGVALGDFRVVRRLGGGSMGTVYLARQASADRDVALKVLHQHLAGRPDLVDRFYREARVMARLRHSGLARLYGAGAYKGLVFLAMEFVDGVGTAALLERLGGRFAVGDALHVVLRCAEALDYMHRHGVVHRDVKPGNVLVTRRGRVKIADLGLAKPLDEDLTLTATGVGLGTPPYVAPEQARSAKHADARSDVYALGVVLYQFLTGTVPFGGGNLMEVVEAKRLGRFTAARRRNPEVPERLDAILRRMLAGEPDRRYPSCAALAADVETLGLANARLGFMPLPPAPGGPAV